MAVKDEEKRRIALEILKELIRKDDTTIKNFTDDHAHHLVKKSVYMTNTLISQVYRP